MKNLESIGAFLLILAIAFFAIVGIYAAEGYWNVWGEMAFIKAINPANLNPWLNYWNLFNLNLSYAVLYYYPNVWWTYTLFISGVIAIIVATFFVAAMNN